MSNALRVAQRQLRRRPKPHGVAVDEPPAPMLLNGCRSDEIRDDLDRGGRRVLQKFFPRQHVSSIPHLICDFDEPTFTIIFVFSPVDSNITK